MSQRPWIDDIENAPEGWADLVDAARLDQPTHEAMSAMTAGLEAKLGVRLEVPSDAVGAVDGLAEVADATVATVGEAATGVASAGATTGSMGASGLGISTTAKVVLAIAAVGGGSFVAGREFEKRVADRPTTPHESKAHEINTQAAKVSAVSGDEPMFNENPSAPIDSPPPSNPVTSPSPSGIAPSHQVSGRQVTTKPLSEEQMLKRAVEALKNNQPKSALRWASRHQKRYPQGVLAEEREVVAIDALARMGDAQKANVRAERFRRTYPTSSHLLRIEGLVGP